MYQVIDVKIFEKIFDNFNALGMWKIIGILANKYIADCVFAGTITVRSSPEELSMFDKLDWKRIFFIFEFFYKCWI